MIKKLGNSFFAKLKGSSQDENKKKNENKTSSPKNEDNSSVKNSPNSNEKPNKDKNTSNDSSKKSPLGKSTSTPVNKPPKKKKSPLKTTIIVLLVILLIFFFISLFFRVPTYYVSDFGAFMTDISDGVINSLFDDNFVIREIWASAEYYESGGGMQIVLTFESTDGDRINVVQYFDSAEIQTIDWNVMIGPNEFFVLDSYTHQAFVTELNRYLETMIITYTGDPDNYHGAAFLPPPVPWWFWTLLITWGPWLFFFVLAWIIIKKMMDKQQGDMSIAKSKAQLQISNIKFKDVAGYQELKTELKEMVDYLKMPEKFILAGAKTPKGVLMEGPPGTGKTLFAKAVAGEAGVPFFTVSGSDFVEMFIGVGAARIRNMFKEAKETGKCLIFIDEIDAVGRARGAGVGGGNDEREQTLNQLLVEMDGFNSNSSIIVMAATNRADVLDPALIRPGRFDRKVTLRLPDVLEREAILQVHLGNKELSSKVNLAEIARRTPGFSGAQLENVLNEAAILSVREGQNVITTDLIDEAIDRIIGGGPAKISKVVSREEKKIIAYHEAGHAIIGLKLEHAQLVQKITIIPRGDAGGYVLMTPKKEKMIQTKAELIASITSYIGGRASEELFFGAENVSSGASADIHSATEIARMMVTQLGMSSKLGPIQFGEEKGSPFLGKELSMGMKHSSKIQYEIDLEIKKLIDDALKIALITIKKHKKLLIQIADYLMINEIITAEEIRYIEKNNKVPPKNFFSATLKEKEDAKKKLVKREIENNKLEKSIDKKIDNEKDKKTSPEIKKEINNQKSKPDSKTTSAKKPTPESNDSNKTKPNATTTKKPQENLDKEKDKKPKK